MVSHIASVSILEYYIFEVRVVSYIVKLPFRIMFVCYIFQTMLASDPKQSLRIIITGATGDHERPRETTGDHKRPLETAHRFPQKLKVKLEASTE